MTDNTDREKLMAEAKAGLAAFDEYWGEGAPVNAEHGRPWELIRGLLAVFEKAHTPTYDEREALIQMLHYRRSQWHSYGTGQNADLADEILSTLADFRRTAVAEPSTESTHRGTFGHVWPRPLFYVGNWKRGDEGYEPVRECSNSAVCELEPQGEPSDAVVLREFVNRLPFGEPCSRQAVTALRAALSAASSVTKGENRD